MRTDSDLSVSTTVRPFVRVREERTSVREPHVQTPSAHKPPCIILGVGPAPGAPHPMEPRPGPAQQTETTKSLQSVLVLTFD